MNERTATAMTEYIDKEEAIAWFMPYVHTGECIDADVVISDLKGMKAADVAPVKHERWIEGEDEYGMILKCSACGEEFVSWEADCARTNYCSNCGCRMDGDADA